LLFAQPDPPLNLVVILADDLGWRDLSCMGSQYYETPHLDRLAAQGLRFTQAYAAAPVCAPTRAALMTGKTPARIHLTAVFDRDQGEKPLLPPDWIKELPHREWTLAERLKAQGYLTALMGKWHLGLTPSGWPEAHGFDHNVAGWKSGRPASYFAPYQNPRLADGPEDEYLTDRLADEAAQFIATHADTNFFLYLPFYSPHAPLEAPAPTIARFVNNPPDGGQRVPAYAAIVAHLDAAVGTVVEALDAAGVRDHTLIVFTSDNGGVRSIWDTHITDNAPLRGEKFQLYEGGIRVPMIVHWPGYHQGGAVSEQLVSTQDLLPTLLACVGAPVEEVALDGLDLSEIFRYGDRAHVKRDLAWHYPHYMPRQDMRPCSALRSENWKLIHWLDTHQLELYRLDQDVGETTNLAPEAPEVALRLYQRLDQWRTQVGAQMPQPNPAYAH
jgi:arylsulfatase A-like enzyme